MENININISYKNECNCPSCTRKKKQPLNPLPLNPLPFQPLRIMRDMLFENGEYLVPLRVGKNPIQIYAVLSTNSPDIVLIDKTCMNDKGNKCITDEKYGQYDYRNSTSCVTVPSEDNVQIKCSQMIDLKKYEYVDTKRLQETVTELTIWDWLDITNKYTKMRVAVKIVPKSGLPFSPQPSILGLSPNNISSIKYFHIIFDVNKPTITFDEVKKIPKANLMAINKSYTEYNTAYTGYVNRTTYNNIDLSKKITPVIFASGNTINILPTDLFNIVIKNIEIELEKIFGSTIILDTMYDIFKKNNYPLSSNEVENNYNKIENMPSLFFEFKTTNGGIFKWEIRDYITIMGGYVRSMFTPHGVSSNTANFIVLGNTGMFGKELSFDSRKSEPIVSVY